MLTARLLKDVSDVNHYAYADQAEFVEGDTPTVYFQLAEDAIADDLRPPGRRYIPPTGSTLSVLLKGIDSSLDLTKTCTNPFVDDRSIWSFSIASTDVIVGDRAMKLTLTEPIPGPSTTTKSAFVNRALVWHPVNPEF